MVAGGIPSSTLRGTESSRSQSRRTSAGGLPFYDTPGVVRFAETESRRWAAWDRAWEEWRVSVLWGEGSGMDGGDGRTIMQIFFVPLSYALKNGQDGKFCVFFTVIIITY